MTGRRVRVAVTGMGVKCPAGNDPEDVFRRVLHARPTAAVVPGLAEAGLPVRFACTVPEFDLAPYIGRREARQIDRATALLLCAADDAVAGAGGAVRGPGHRAGVHIGTGIGGLPGMEEVVYGHGERPMGMPVHTVPKSMANSPACRLAMRYGLRGSCMTYATACASGTNAIGEAARRIRDGELDVALTGGVDAAVTKVIVSGFARMRALSVRNEAPELASRPFDADRDGFVMGEGAAVLVLERWDLARRRGARIYGEVAGYATTCDGAHAVAPDPQGAMAAECMRLAIADARLTPAGIGHINAHGTSTVLNDLAEAVAVERCFGPQSPPVTAVKGVTGHLIGGSGAVEALVALLCAARGVVPPVATTASTPDVGALDVVLGAPRQVARRPVLSNSFGFGGQNACLVLRPAP
ncbi:beta-ketoacyl-[acyl-carrier-protein] synthase family protein [Streptomyces sp. MP131-18]|uniref:beta-ketoacyl-[acyl-carrier-protein] synthase family protein n=1 Tax=Streptomyces sp. MP131-18 TaxID=1857892 RepID=UPI00097CB8FA|nr:beta-ketoacyl-[acyl-carrier-protein] synthase family protein [Streptomyces sp. MP131-18]ONK11686.1 3-oxoacyl-[acyl-carrier-protein] synthase 2 [Streptomyces sp. MP131-18]